MVSFERLTTSKILEYPLLEFGDRYIVSDTFNIYDTEKKTNVIPYISNTGYIFCRIFDINESPHIIRIDKMIAYTFSKWKFFDICGDIEVIHTNGDTLNNSPWNLSIIPSVEIWKTITNIDIAENMYEISTYGNVRKICNRRPLSTHIRNGYKQVNLQRKNGQGIQKAIHRLVAEEFVINNRPDRIFVNHIDGIKTNNKWDNLEWVTPQENVKHAFFFEIESIKRGSSNNSAIINEDIAKHIWLLLIDDENELNGRPKTNGSPTKVQQYLQNENIDVSIPVIANIKTGSVWKEITCKGHHFNNLQHIINEDIAKHIWLLLIDDENELNGRPKTNGSPECVRQYLFEYDNICIKRSIIEAIKNGRSWKNITRTLPQKDFTDIRCSAIINEDIAKHIWLLLIDDENELNGRPKTNGSPNAVAKLLKDEGLDILGGPVNSIKHKKAWKHITSMLPQKDFKILHGSNINEDIAKHIWLLLIDDENELNGRPKTNGSPTKVQQYLQNENIDVSIPVIKGIKYRSTWRHVSE